MSKIRAIYDATQHCTVLQDAKGKSVASDACSTGGGKGEELSPAELVGAGLASCMLFTMGMVAMRDGLNIAGTTVDVEVSIAEKPLTRIGSIELTFNFLREFPTADRIKLQRATEKCPIKPSLHPDIAIQANFVYPERSRQPRHSVAACA